MKNLKKVEKYMMKIKIELNEIKNTEKIKRISLIFKKAVVK